MLIAGILIFVSVLVLLGFFIGKIFGGRGILLLGLIFALGLVWLSYRLLADVRTGAAHPDDGYVVYFYAAVFIVMTLTFATCYGVLALRQKLPRQRG